MVPLFSQLKTVSEEGNRAVFEFDGLYPGYGVTLGNSLRRVLLSSLEGASVTKMKIKNVPHEFTTIPGVYEDVIQIMLNVKKLRFKMHGSEPQKATLKIKGEKEVKGKDFGLPSQLELINKDEKVVTLTDRKAEIEMEIEVEKGMGYVARETRKRDKLAVGEILVDAIYSPVKKVGYSIEQMRVGERTDFDKLKIELETDGSLSPVSAMKQAAQILLDHFSLVAQSFAGKEVAQAVKEEKPKKKKPAAKPAKKKPVAKSQKKTK